mmetsp:Transcript_60635/g.161133  ORF Transcript_60635/g.161133 Transcript_60635/m.161133 type:complete len:240 (+) Transcript_60635:667-1386(+)
MHEIKELKDQHERHHDNHREVLMLLGDHTDQFKEELAKHASAQGDKFNEYSATHKASLDDNVAKLNRELGKVARDHEDRQGKLRSAVVGAVEATERKLRGELGQLRRARDDRNKELCDLVFSSLEALEFKLREEHANAMKNMGDLHDSQRSNLDHASQTHDTRREVSQMAKDHERHRDIFAEMMSGQAASEAKLRREMERMSKEHCDEHARARNARKVCCWESGPEIQGCHAQSREGCR